MTPVEALEIALKKEEAAIEQYQKMVVDYPEISELCTDLQNEEFKHKKLIQSKIVELTRY